MSLFGIGHTSYSLKDLLENPILQNPPQFNKDGGNAKKEKGSLSPTFDPTSAFLGPNLWGTSEFTTESDVSLEYMDLDEFLSENGIPVDLNENSNSSDKTSVKDQPTKIQSPKVTEPDSTQCVSSPLSPASEAASPEDSVQEKSIINDGSRSPLNLNVEFKISEQEVALATVPVLQTEEQHSPGINVDFDIDEGEQDLVNVPGEETFDPKSRKFSEDELKPQPMIKKSRKVFVPDEQKDDKYWSRRKKNNIAAKRSRDARRVKENQIAMRAAYLEKCNQTLAEEIKKLKTENSALKKSLEEAQEKLKT